MEPPGEPSETSQNPARTDASVRYDPHVSPAARPAVSPPLRAPAADPLRTRILGAAAEIFGREGYRNTDLQDVADVLAIGKGSVYRRFPSKRELFLATVDDGMRRLKGCVDVAIADVDDPLERLASAVRAYLAFFDAEPRLAELVILERAEFRDRKKSTYFEHREVNVGRWRALYARLMDEKRVRRMPIDRITDVISNLVYGTMFTNHFAGRTKSFEEQAADILDVVFHGILTRPKASRRSPKRRKERV